MQRRLSEGAADTSVQVAAVTVVPRQWRFSEAIRFDQHARACAGPSRRAKVRLGELLGGDESTSDLSTAQQTGESARQQPHTAVKVERADVQSQTGGPTPWREVQTRYQREWPNRTARGSRRWTSQELWMVSALTNRCEESR